jgi:Fe-S oxidoreductase
MGVIRKSENLLNSDNNTRAEGWGWMVEDELNVATLINKKAKVGYFVGCLTSFKPSLDFIAQNTVRILHRIGEDFTIL